MAATVETVKEERPAIALSCKRKVGQAVLKTTGELCIPFKKSKLTRLKHFNDVFSNAFVFRSETWILPIITLGVMVVYAALAIFFYNSDA